MLLTRSITIMTLLAAVSLTSGCIQRTITVTSEPTGALVYLNDTEVGRTPVTVPFKFYGVYDVRIEQSGYQTLTIAQKAKAPWWEAPGPDLIAEAIPGERNVNLEWHFVLSEQQPVDQAQLIDRGKQLRAWLNADTLAPPQAPEAPATETPESPNTDTPPGPTPDAPPDATPPQSPSP